MPSSTRAGPEFSCACITAEPAAQPQREKGGGGPSPEQFQPVGVWQSLREDGKARSCSTGKEARKETRVILSQPPAVPPQRRSTRGARAATDPRISAQWPRPHRRRGEETRTDSSSDPGRLSGARADHRQLNMFRARPCAPWSSAPRVEGPNGVPRDPRLERWRRGGWGGVQGWSGVGKKLSAGEDAEL